MIPPPVVAHRSTRQPFRTLNDIGDVLSLPVPLWMVLALAVFFATFLWAWR